MSWLTTGYPGVPVKRIFLMKPNRTVMNDIWKNTRDREPPYYEITIKTWPKKKDVRHYYIHNTAIYPQ